jgi:hypothetical protein
MSWEDIMRRVLPPIGGVSPHITGPAGKYGAGLKEGRVPPSTIPHGGADFNYIGGKTARLNLSHPALRSSAPSARDLPSDETAGSNPVRYVSGRIMGQPQVPISNTGAQAAPPSPQVGGPPVGIFSGQPMLSFPLPPSFWSRRDDNRAPDDDEEERSSRWLRPLSPQ